jgi:hypothetical protein
MTVDESIHDYEQHLARARCNINLLRNGKTALRFINHLSVLGLSIARVTKYAA